MYLYKKQGMRKRSEKIELHPFFPVSLITFVRKYWRRMITVAGRRLKYSYVANDQDAGHNWPFTGENTHGLIAILSPA